MMALVASIAGTSFAVCARCPAAHAVLNKITQTATSPVPIWRLLAGDAFTSTPSTVPHHERVSGVVGDDHSDSGDRRTA